MIKSQTKKIKIKPKYNIFQNTAYALKNIWESGQKMIAVATVARIPVALTLSIIALYTPRVILNSLEFSDTMRQMIAVMIALLAVTMIFNLIDTFIEIKRTAFSLRLIGYYGMIRYKKYLDADYEHLEDPKFQNINQKTAEALMNNMTPALQLQDNFANLMINIFSLIFFGSVISTLNPLILLLLIATVFINYFMMKSIKNHEHKIKDKRAAVSRKLSYLANMSKDFKNGKDIRLYGMAEWFQKMAGISTIERQNMKKGIEYRYFGASLINFLILFFRDGGAYIYLIYRAVAGDINAGDFVLYFAAIGQFARWFQGIIDKWLDVHTGSLQICDIREFLEYENKTNRGKGIELPKGSEGLSIELKNVAYQYPKAEAPTIKNINLKISAGEKIAVVGLNGAGKTTLVKLICGMYSPTEGEILVNGHKVSEYNIEEYYTLFSAVFQKFRFLPVTISQNISIVPKEQADTKKIEDCIELAGLKEKISSLNKGIDTPLIKEINSDATELSGGEQQKLMLARAIYKDALVLILDEPTAALDPIAESEMYMKYNEITKNKTSVFISHRLASTRFCDRIILISDGEIAETGTHEELVKKGGKYAELYDIQRQYYKDNITGNESGAKI